MHKVSRLLMAFLLLSLSLEGVCSVSTDSTKSSENSCENQLEKTPDLLEFLSVNASVFVRIGAIEAYLDSGLREKVLRGGFTAEKLAFRLKFNADATSRFVNLLAYVGVIEKSDETVSDKFNAEDLARFKTSWARVLASVDDPKLLGSPLRALLLHYKLVMEPMFRSNVICAALKSGTSQWNLAFGANVASPFDIYRSHPDLMETLMEGMHALSEPDSKLAAASLARDGVYSILDVGGGTGALALALKAKFFEASVSVYDLPEAQPILRKLLNRKNSANLEIKSVAGNFLLGNSGLDGLALIQKFDLIVLSWVLHDWDEATSIAILKKVRTHLSPQGHVVILEQFLPESRVSSETILDIAMLLQTDGGRERTEAEWRGLLKQAGFQNTQITKTAGRRHLIEGY